MEQERLTKIVKALTDKGVKAPCPRCGEKKFSIVGETLIVLQTDPAIMAISGGPSVPAVLIACDHCGFLTEHASIRLGLVKGGEQ